MTLIYGFSGGIFIVSGIRIMESGVQKKNFVDVFFLSALFRIRVQVMDDVKNDLSWFFIGEDNLISWMVKDSARIVLANE